MVKRLHGPGAVLLRGWELTATLDLDWHPAVVTPMDLWGCDQCVDQLPDLSDAFALALSRFNGPVVVVHETIWWKS